MLSATRSCSSRLRSLLRHFSTGRHEGILMNPEGLSRKILPGNLVEQVTASGTTRQRYVELVHGYFWMVKDLRQTDEKPILPSWIPSKEAKVFPTITNLTSLSGNRVDFPDALLQSNRSSDPSAQCTLVLICFRDFGYQMLDSWAKVVPPSPRLQTVRLNVSEGWMNRWILQAPLTSLMRRNTPEELQDSTYVFFGNADDFRDDLRMHNLLTGYAFLLDGQGRVRFAASGSATDDEAQLLQKAVRKILKT